MEEVISSSADRPMKHVNEWCMRWCVAELGWGGMGWGAVEVEEEGELRLDVRIGCRGESS